MQRNRRSSATRPRHNYSVILQGSKSVCFGACGEAMGLPALLHKREASYSSPCPLTEQHRAHFRVVDVDLRRRLDANGEGAFDRGAGADGFEPAHEMRKLRKILALPLGEADPAHAGDVGD